MYISFEQIPSSARIWIYQANRAITDSERHEIENTLKPAVSQWAAHGASLLASVKVLHNRFVIIALDENQNEASGCSIDASTRWFKELGNRLNIDFFDRSQAYVDESGLISPDTIIFVNNNNIHTLADLAGQWKVKASESYLKRFFNNVGSPA
jgi:hypothetical protein